MRILKLKKVTALVLLTAIGVGGSISNLRAECHGGSGYAECKCKADHPNNPDEYNNCIAWYASEY